MFLALKLPDFSRMKNTRSRLYFFRFLQTILKMLTNGFGEFSSVLERYSVICNNLAAWPKRLPEIPQKCPC